MRRRILVPVGVLVSLCLFGAFPGRARAAFEHDVLSITSNAVCGAGPTPELIDVLTGPEREAAWRISASSSELYGLADLRSAAVSLSRESAGRWLTVGASSFGGRLYREGTVEVAGMRRWSGDVVVGVRGRGLCLSWAGGAPEWSGTVDLSAAWLVHGRLVVGLSVRNATRSRILSSPVASSVSSDAALVLDGVTVLASLSGEPGFAPSPAVGCDLALASWLRLRAGVMLEPSSSAFGLRLGGGRAMRPDLDLTWCRHPVLGSSYSLTVSIRI